jgi:hypothetical protein
MSLDLGRHRACSLCLRSRRAVAELLAQVGAVGTHRPEEYPMAHYVCVIFDELSKGRAAYTALSSSTLAIDMDDVHLHYREMREDKLPLSQTRSRNWTAWSGGVGVVVGVLIGAIAWWLGALDEVPLLYVMGLSGLLCGVFGALGGILLGATLPAKPLADALPMLEPGRVAIVAEFDHDAEARAAEQFLMARGGVVCNKPESVFHLRAS